MNLVYQNSRGLKNSLRFLSRLKNHLVSLDLMDVYEMKKAHDRASETENHQDIAYCVHRHVEALDLVQQIRPMSVAEQSFAKARLERGDRLVIGTLDRMPVFYGWLMFGELEMTYDVFLPTPAQNAFGYNIFTARSHRRQGFMTKFYQFAACYVSGRNCDRLRVGISVGNKASIKAHLRNGFVKTGSFYTLILFGTCFTWARFEQMKPFHITAKPRK